MEKEFKDYFTSPGVLEQWKKMGVGVMVQLPDISITPANQDPYSQDVCIRFLIGTPEQKHSGNLTSFSVHLRSLPGCCGVLLLHTFSTYYPPPRAHITLAMRAVQYVIGRNVKDKIWGRLVLATTIPSQPQFIQVLKDLKFIPGVVTSNPRTSDTEITTWTKSIRPSALPQPRVTNVGRVTIE